MAEYMKVADVLFDYTDGDGNGWPTEFTYLREVHAAKIRELTLSILQHGIKEPILLGDDGRVWDGHHRLYVALHMGLEYVPAKYAREVRDVA